MWILCSVCFMNIMKVIMVMIIRIMFRMIGVDMVFEWFCVRNCVRWFGILVMMLMKMISEMLLLMLWVVICLFSYIRNIVLLISVIIMDRWKNMFGLCVRLLCLRLMVRFYVWNSVSVIVL